VTGAVQWCSLSKVIKLQAEMKSPVQPKQHLEAFSDNVIKVKNACLKTDQLLAKTSG
jgi:hypothetical protein